MIDEYLYFTNRDEWRTWLEQNHAQKREAWLIHYKKHMGDSGISYEHAVEEALCFGWIDGLLRSIDGEKYALRYSPRKRNAIWAESNKKRAEMLISQGRMTRAGLEVIKQAKKSGEWHNATLRDKLIIPPDLDEALSLTKMGLRNFERLTPSRRKQLIWWITSAKRQETRKRRVSETVRLVQEDENIPDR